MGYQRVRQKLYAVACITLLGCVVSIPLELEAKPRGNGPTRQQCADASMIIILHTDGGYDCCVDWGVLGVKGCSVDKNCLRCDKDAHCTNDPITPEWHQCMAKVIGAPIHQERQVSIIKRYWKPSTAPALPGSPPPLHSVPTR
jgi:hypothetical protein